MGRGARGRARDGDARRAAVRAHGAAEERRRTRVHVLHGLRVAEGTRARGEPARRAALPPPGHPGARRRAASSGCPTRSRTPTGPRGPKPRGAARPPRTSRSRSAPARSSRRRSTRSLRNRPARSAGAATGSSRTRTSSGGTATTGCTNVTFSGHAVTAGTLSCCSREAARRRSARPRPCRFDTVVGTDDRRLPGLPGVEPVEPEGRHAAGRVGLGAADRVDGRRRGRARRLRQRSLRRLADRHPVRRRAREVDAEVARHVRVRGRERQGPVPDPGQRADRGRAAACGSGRPARADRRPRRVQALRALRDVEAERQVVGLVRRDLEPPLERAAPRGLDVRRCRRPADPARARALGGRRVDRRDQARAALHRRSARAARTSTPRATTRAA